MSRVACKHAAVLSAAILAASPELRATLDASEQRDQPMVAATEQLHHAGEDQAGGKPTGGRQRVRVILPSPYDASR